MARRPSDLPWRRPPSLPHRLVPAAAPKPEKHGAALTSSGSRLRWDGYGSKRCWTNLPRAAVDRRWPQHGLPEQWRTTPAAGTPTLEGGEACGVGSSPPS